MSYKIVFFDIDGTLYDPQHQLPLSVYRAIPALRERGIHVALATGRSVAMAKHAQSELSIDTLITFNGAHASSDQMVLFEETLPPLLLQKVHQAAVASGGAVSYSGLHASYAMPEYFSRRRDDFSSLHLGSIVETDHPPAVPVYGMTFTGTAEIQQNLAAELPELSFLPWSDNFGALNCDLMLRHINKSVGISHVLAHFGLSPSDAVAFGDGYNDVEMLRYVGLGIAMGNGKPEVMEAADFVTRRADEDGILYGLQAAGLLP